VKTKTSISRFPLAHTYSIVAHDPDTGAMGVAVQSHWFSVGSVVTWGEAGVGVVATQAFAEIAYGPQGLALMRDGLSAPEALKKLLDADESRELRQVAMVDASGKVGVHTGVRCIPQAGHEMGIGYSTQANMMLSSQVWMEMAMAFRAAEGELAERLVTALQAAQAVGGDVRGQQSACVLVVSGRRSDSPWREVLVELRVEDHPQPVEELARLVQVDKAYELMNKGDAYLGDGDIPSALTCYSQASAIAPHMPELPFWHAVTLADLDRLEEALPIFREVFRINPNWALLVQRLPEVGLLKEDAEMMTRIVAQV
jgi:uncharacterized Ntn-hydrolase superfamily protein